MLKIKDLTIPCVGKVVEIFNRCEECNLIQESSLENLQNLLLKLPYTYRYDSAMARLGVYPTGTQANVLYTMFIVASLVLVSKLEAIQISNSRKYR